MDNRAVPNTSFVQIDLKDMIEQVGEEKVKLILSSFKCPHNLDVQNFLHSKAIEFTKRGFSMTTLVFWTTEDGSEKALVGYYAIANKTMTVAQSAVSNTVARKLKDYGTYNSRSREYVLAAYLIGQLGKNFAYGNDTLISGSDLLQLAIDRINTVRAKVGGKFAYLECEDCEKLLGFYQDNRFVRFGNRPLDGDETDLRGKYLVQLFTMLD